MKQSQQRAYDLRPTEAQISQDNKNGSDSTSTGQYQVNEPCPVCGLWYRIDGRCNKLEKHPKSEE